MHSFIQGLLLTAVSGASLAVHAKQPLQYEDVFQLEFVSQPQLNKNGSEVVFVRNRFDQALDKRVGSLWLSNTKTGQLQPLVAEQADISSPQWSPDGKKLLFVSAASGKPQIHMRWLDTGSSGQISHLPHAPTDISWSPDGKWLAFSMFTPVKAKNPVTLPGKPEQNDWAKAPVYIDTMQYRADGRGYLPSGYRQIYLMAVDGGTPIQLTSGDFDHAGEISWQADGKAFYFSANRQADKRAQAQNSDIYLLTVADKKLTQIIKMRASFIYF